MPSGLFTRRQHLQAVITNSWAGRPSSVDYLVVAGGGGGGRNWGGGGGAGGLLQGTIAAPTTATTVTVGAGGLGDTSDINPKGGTSGGNSIFGAIVALGGGLGGSYNGIAGAAGGSGGGQGAGSNPGTLGQGTFGQGNAGGSSPPENVNSQNTTGGGGGAGTIGISSTTTIAGRGGSGIASDMSGSRVLYAGGGGGTANAGATGAGAGGVGGGGTGSWYGTSNAISGTPNTGGGGGGAHYTGISGTGGSGIVIISYPGTTQWYSGGTLSYSNNRVTHTFYSSGTLTPIQPVEYADTTYQISRSLRFNSTDSAYLSRTPASASNRKTWTWSGWVKWSSSSTEFFFLSQYTDASNRAYCDFRTSNTLFLFNRSGGVTTAQLETTQVFRDFSAWYHVVIAVDTTQATDSNRIKFYVNNSQITAFSTATYPSQNAELQFNSTGVHRIGSYDGAFDFSNGYLTEVNFIDGLALTPQAFGFTNPNTGVWSPLRYTGSYGTNGFYLNFSDNSNNTASTLGKDNSGNTNNWTPNNFSVTAGADNDSLVDTPTPYGSDTGAGGTVRGNYPTINSINMSANMTSSDGNLKGLASAAAVNVWPIAHCTMAFPNTGKWYWEYTAYPNGTANDGFAQMIGIVPSTAVPTQNVYVGNTGNGYGLWIPDGSGGSAAAKRYNSSNTTLGSNFALVNGDVFQIAFDAANGKIWFGKNNTWYEGNPSTDTTPSYSSISTSTAWIPIIQVWRSGNYTNNYAYLNFGQRPFAYTAPSGFKSLCTQNLPTPAVVQGDDYFNTVLWTGNGSTPRNITGVGFQPDLVWIKERSAADDHIVSDSVRGTDGSTYYRLFTNSTSAESVNSQNTVITLNSDGFSIGSGPSVNTSADTYVAWNWKANGAGSTNTAGSITSTVSANQTSGFSIVAYNSGASGDKTVGHGLGVAPSMIITKSRTAVSSYNWSIYHASVATTVKKYLVFTTDALSDNGSNIWGSAFPTSSVFGITSGNGVNASTDCIAYCFAEVAGYSKFGSYTGNGSADGPFVYCGFRPRWLMIKNSSANSITAYGSWKIIDTSRYVYNGGNPAALYANASYAEGNRGDGSSDTFTERLDLLSNGFKLGAASSYDIETNESGVTYIYAAFAETPFKYSRAR